MRGARFDRAHLERWGDADHDGRHGPNTVPANKLSDTERRKLIAIATSAEFRDHSPSQIVPRLADRGEYVASESTFYRVLRDEDMQHHRGRSRPPTSRPHEHIADRPWQVASWDITYLRSLVRGQFFYLYLVEDVWSRKILGWEVHDFECNELAAALVERIRRENPGVELRGWVLHSDNGGPMRARRCSRRYSALVSSLPSADRASPTTTRYTSGMTISLQERFAPNGRCFGCGPANAQGLRIRSFPTEDAADPHLICDFIPAAHHEAFENVLNGGIIGTVLDCHMNWTTIFYLMKQQALDHAPPCVTSEFTVTLKRPTPMGPVHVDARVVSATDDRATIEAIMTAGSKVTAIGTGTFVAVKPGHPAYYRW